MKFMGVNFQFRSHLGRNPGWPVEPSITLRAGQAKHMGDGLRTIDQVALELGEANLVGLRLNDFVDGPGLQQGGATSG